MQNGLHFNRLENPLFHNSFAVNVQLPTAPKFYRLPICFFVLFLLAFTGKETGIKSHDYHQSDCLLEYFPESGRMQISLNIFIDDLEEAFVLQGKEKQGLFTRKELPGADAQIMAYLESRFKLSAGGREIPLELINREMAGDLMTMVCYLEARPGEPVGELRITNRLLCEVFEDQKNFVRILTGGSTLARLWFDTRQQTEIVAL